MVVRVTVGRRALDVVVFFLANVELAPDDWLNSGFVRGIHEMDGAKNIAVIGHRDGGHAQFLHAMDELFHVTGAIEHGVISMEMQVDELGH